MMKINIDKPRVFRLTVWDDDGQKASSPLPKVSKYPTIAFPNHHAPKQNTTEYKIPKDNQDDWLESEELDDEPNHQPHAQHPIYGLDGDAL
jgi:hypothetical protein